jgi:hypothetical protein
MFRSRRSPLRRSPLRRSPLRRSPYSPLRGGATLHQNPEPEELVAKPAPEPYSGLVVDSLIETLMKITSFKEFYRMRYMNKLTREAVNTIVSNPDLLKRKLMNTNNADIEKLYRIRNTIPIHMRTLFSLVLLEVIKEKKIMRIAKIINPGIWLNVKKNKFFVKNKRYSGFDDPRLIRQIRQIKSDHNLEYGDIIEYNEIFSRDSSVMEYGWGKIQGYIFLLEGDKFETGSQFEDDGLWKHVNTQNTKIKTQNIKYDFSYISKNEHVFGYMGGGEETFWI